MASKPLNEETSAIYNLLQELQIRNAAFEALVKERFYDTAGRTDIVLKEARMQLDEAYRAMVERINALIIVEGVADYESFAKTLNAIVAKYAVKKHHHKTSEPRWSGFKDLQENPRFCYYINGDTLPLSLSVKFLIFIFLPRRVAKKPSRIT